MGATTYTQEDTRARNDDGTISTATYMGSGNNENQSLDVDLVFRWRFVIQCGGMNSGDRNFELWASKNGGAYAAVTSVTTFGLQLANDGYSIADNSLAVQDIGDGSYTSQEKQGFCDGTIDDDTGIVDIDVGTEAEVEFCFQMPTGDAANGDYFDLRVRNGATVLDTYTNTPRVTAIAEAIVSFAAVSLAASVTPDTVDLNVLREFAAIALGATVTPDTVDLGLIKSFAAAALGATATPDTVNMLIIKSFAAIALAATTSPDTVNLNVLRAFAAAALGASNTPDTIVMTAIREMAAIALAVSATPDNISLLGRVDFSAISLAASATSTPDLDLGGAIVEFAAAALASSSTPSANLTLYSLAILTQVIQGRRIPFITPVLIGSEVSEVAVKNFSAIAAAVTNTDDTVVLNVLREMAAIALGATNTNDTVAIAILREYAAASLAATTTPDTVDLLIIKTFAATALATSNTPDTAMLGIIFGFAAEALAATSTPDTVVMTAIKDMAAQALAATDSPDIVVLGIMREHAAQALGATATPDNILLLIIKTLTTRDILFFYTERVITNTVVIDIHADEDLAGDKCLPANGNITLDEFNTAYDHSIQVVIAVNKKYRRTTRCSTADTACTRRIKVVDIAPLGVAVIKEQEGALLK